MIIWVWIEKIYSIINAWSMKKLVYKTQILLQTINTTIDFNFYKNKMREINLLDRLILPLKIYTQSLLKSRFEKKWRQNSNQFLRESFISLSQFFNNCSVNALFPKSKNRFQWTGVPVKIQKDRKYCQQRILLNWMKKVLKRTTKHNKSGKKIKSKTIQTQSLYQVF